MLGSDSESGRRLYDGLGSSIGEQYSVGRIIILHGQITVREYVDRLCNKMHPTMQTLFSSNYTVFQDSSAIIHTAEPFSPGLKSMKVNFSIIPGQHNHQI
jgi:hypothetical protein